MKITMAELAKLCGYSKATISRALANDPRVKEETKALIREMAEKYNYRPHAVASNLAKRRTKTIGLMFPEAPRTIADPFFLEYLQGVSTTLFEQGFSLLFPRAQKHMITETIEQLVNQSRVDGIILTEPRIHDDRIALLRESGVPFVFLGSTECEQVSWVDGDNQGGVFQAIQKLGALGHSQIATITGEDGLVSTSNRLKGYLEGLKALRLNADPALIWEGDFTHQGGFEAIQNNLETISHCQVTAIFAANDLMAIGAIQALKEAGYKIPEQISVIGFDGIEMGKYLSPPLTTVQQPVYRLGQEVARVLLAQIEQQGNPIQITLPVHVVNETTTIGPCRKEWGR